jgi:hypothetical protein
MFVAKIEGHWLLFIGLLAPNHSRGGVLMILSLTELDFTIVRKKSKRG